jgi:hypothetical protein
MRALSAACSEVRIVRKYKKRSGGACLGSSRDIIDLRYPLLCVAFFDGSTSQLAIPNNAIAVKTLDTLFHDIKHPNQQI